MKIAIITGSAGLIGSQACNFFSEKGYRIIGIDNDMRAWENYKKTFQTLFVDLDGTIVENSSAYLPPYIGQTKPIIENVDYLNYLSNSGRTEIIITTARPERYRSQTENQLKEIGLNYKLLIMDLQHSRRIIINDFSNSNPYKSCESINIPRNSNQLKKYLSI